LINKRKLIPKIKFPPKRVGKINLYKLETLSLRQKQDEQIYDESQNIIFFYCPQSSFDVLSASLLNFLLHSAGGFLKPAQIASLYAFAVLSPS